MASVVINRQRLGHCAFNNRLTMVGNPPNGRCMCGEAKSIIQREIACIQNYWNLELQTIH